jgi:alpha-D-xyloside xylohydrolase
VFDVLEEKLGKGEAVVFARSATTGCQQFPVHWGGDNASTFESMAESLRGGLSLGLSGFGFWSHDIGGFEGTPPVAVYKRWCAFGLLSSHSRLHGNPTYRVPWLFDEEAVDVLRLFTKLKCRLMPYLYAKALDAAQKGIPMMRAMMLEFPDDPTCDYVDCQYMLGESLLVAPIFSSDGMVNYYLPAGRWTNLLSGQVVKGGRWARETHDYFSLPLMVRPNTVLPMGANEQRPDYDYADGVVFHLFELDDGAVGSARVPTLSGEVAMSIQVSRSGKQITVETEGASKAWSILLRGVEAAQSVDGGKAKKDPLGILVTAKAAVSRLTIEL